MSITHPRRTAVALAYAGGRAAPRVVAKGRGLIAEHIVQAGLDAGVPLREAPELAQVLQQVELGREIPPSLYVAVAELLAWVRRLESEATAQTTSPRAASVRAQ